MANKYVFNPFTGTFDLINSSSGSSVTEYASDPATVTEDTFIINTTTNILKLGFSGLWQTVAQLVVPGLFVTQAGGDHILTEDSSQIRTEA